MKFRKFISILALIAFFIISCDDEADNLGKEIRPAGDEIIVKSDTFHLSSVTFPIDNIISKPDSFLLGEFVDFKLGTLKAEILAELKLFKDEFQFPDESVAVTEVDSVTMYLSFNSVFGKYDSPLNISVYELKDSLRRKDVYYTDIDPTPFVDYSKKIGSTKFSVIDGNTENLTRYVNFQLEDEFAKRFFTTDPLHYKSQNDFRNFFKGIYMTTSFGGATMLNLRDIRVSMYYSYAYKTDLTKKLYGRKDFYVNPEVKKVNRIVHTHRALVVNPNDEFNHIASPANYYTRVMIPLDRVRRDVKIDGKTQLAVNSASIKLHVEKKNDEDDASMIPYVNNLLLIKADSVNEFFTKRKPLSNSYAFLAGRDSIYVSQDNYRYEFNFTDLAE